MFLHPTQVDPKGAAMSFPAPGIPYWLPQTLVPSGEKCICEKVFQKWHYFVSENLDLLW